MTNAHPTHLLRRDPGITLWATALGLMVSVLMAPVRPWGWTGGTTLILALIVSVGAVRTNPGVPRRWQWPWVIAGGTLVSVCLKWLPTILP